jgi:hypothetical protein
LIIADAFANDVPDAMRYLSEATGPATRFEKPSGENFRFALAEPAVSQARIVVRTECARHVRETG